MHIPFFQLELLQFEILYMYLVLKLTKPQLKFAGQNRQADEGL